MVTWELVFPISFVIFHQQRSNSKFRILVHFKFEIQLIRSMQLIPNSLNTNQNILKRPVTKNQPALRICMVKEGKIKIQRSFIPDCCCKNERIQCISSRFTSSGTARLARTRTSLSTSSSVTCSIPCNEVEKFRKRWSISMYNAVIGKLKGSANKKGFLQFSSIFWIFTSSFNYINLEKKEGTWWTVNAVPIISIKLGNYSFVLKLKSVR